MSIKPNAQVKNIYELFAGKVFKVPDYQRSYSWERKNWEDFWNDIKEGLITNTEHYWGTITLKSTGESLYCKEKDIPFNVFEVVDGQQRITTIYLFLLALAKNGKPNLKDNFIKCGEIYRLELGGLNNEFLKNLVDDKNPEPKIKTNKLLKECLEYFENQIKIFNNLDNLSEYLQRITFSLEFTVVDEILAVKAFESLNDRGKPLTLLDKTKSYLMFVSLRYLNNKLSSKINETFGSIFLDFDIIKGTGEKENIDYIKSERFTEDELLRFFYHYFSEYARSVYNLPIGYDYDATANFVFEMFIKKSCEYLKNKPDDLERFISDFLNDIKKFVNTFKNIIEKTKKECKYRKLLSFLGINTRVYPLLISLEVENILNSNMLALIETLDIRVYKIRGTDPRAKLYRDVITKIKLEPESNKIRQEIKNFIGEFMPDPLFKHYLNQNIYDNPATKFILWEYEKYKNKNFNDCDTETYFDLQKEHIFAQNPKPVFPSYGFLNENEYFAHIDRLGNLCLLEEKLNKQCQNKLPEQKKEYYQQSKISTTKEIGFFVDNKIFDKNKIDERTEEIVDFCIKRWAI